MLVVKNNVVSSKCQIRMSTASSKKKKWRRRFHSKTSYLESFDSNRLRNFVEIIRIGGHCGSFTFVYLIKNSIYSIPNFQPNRKMDDADFDNDE